MPKFVFLISKFVQDLDKDSPKKDKDSPKKDKDVRKIDKDVRKIDNIVQKKGHSMWLTNLKELRTAKGLSPKQIAEMANLPERTVVRIFSGDTPNPYVDTLYRIVAVLDGSLDDVFADSKTVVGSKNLAILQSDVDRLKAEKDLLTAENAMLTSKVASLTAENDILRMKLEHKDEIIALHNYYESLLNGSPK